MSTRRSRHGAVSGRGRAQAARHAGQERQLVPQHDPAGRRLPLHRHLELRQRPLQQVRTLELQLRHTCQSAHVRGEGGVGRDMRDRRVLEDVIGSHGVLHT